MEQRKTSKPSGGQAKEKSTGKKAKQKTSSKPKVTLTQKESKPSSLVKRPAGFRKGRGFSIPELQSVQVSLAYARRLRLPIDLRRGTKNDVNIKALRKWVVPSKTSKAIQKTPKQASKNL